MVFSVVWAPRGCSWGLKVSGVGQRVQLRIGVRSVTDKERFRGSGV